MSRPEFQQVTGGGSRIVLYPELSPGVVDPAASGVVLAIHEDTLAVASNKQTSSVITGRRGAGKPVAGQPDYSGGLTLAAYAAQMGHIVRSLCGAPVTTPETSLSLSAADVTDEGNGFVGLPVSGNTFVQDCAITVTGTTNYNGTYRCAEGTTSEKVVISAVYKAEKLTATAKVHRGKAAFFEGPAKELEGGLVELPLGGVGTSLSVGDTVTIEGSTNYDGSHVLASGTNSNRLVIKAAFKAESFDGSAVGIPSFWRHEWKLPKKQPTVTIVRELDFEEGAAKEPFYVFQSCKNSGFNFNFGNDEELRFEVAFNIGSAETRAERPNANLEPVNLGQGGWANKETAFWIDDKRTGDVSNGSVSQDYAIQAAAAVGDLGKRYRQTEGDPTCNISFEAFLEHDRYQQLANNNETIKMEISIDSAIGDEFWLHLYESELDTEGPKVNTKAGLTQSFTGLGFVETGDTLVGYTLINRVESYA